MAQIAAPSSAQSVAQSASPRRTLWASGAGYGGIWPVMRNGIVEAGFKSRLRVRYQAGQGAEATVRLLDRLQKDHNSPQGLLLAAAPYALRARIERTLQERHSQNAPPLPFVLIGADTGSTSQPRLVSAIVGVDAFATGIKAGRYARTQNAQTKKWRLGGNTPSLCLRTRRDDPARERLCRGVAVGLGEQVAMLTVAHKRRTAEIDLKRLRGYLEDHPKTPMIWLDDGAFVAEVLEAIEQVSEEISENLAEKTSEKTSKKTSERTSWGIADVPLAVFGLAPSQKAVLETQAERIAFVVDLRPFEQGRRAVALMREMLRHGGAATAPQVVSLSARILAKKELEDILPLIGRTR